MSFLDWLNNHFVQQNDQQTFTNRVTPQVLARRQQVNTLPQSPTSVGLQSVGPTIQNSIQGFNNSRLINNPVARMAGFVPHTPINFSQPMTPAQLSASSRDLAMGTIGGDIGPAKDALTNGAKELAAGAKDLAGNLAGKIDRKVLTGKALLTPTRQLTEVMPHLNITPEDQQIAEGLTSLHPRKGKVAGFIPELKDNFESWVNNRRATQVESLLQKKTFSNLDQFGLQGLTEFQNPKSTVVPTEAKTQLRDFFDTKFNELKKAGVDLGYRAEYLPQLWDNSPEQITQAYKRLSLKPGFTKEAIFKNYAEGIQAGLTPRFQKLSDLAAWYEGTANKAMADRKFFDFLTNNHFIQPTTQSPAGWTKLDTNIFPNRKVAYTDPASGKVVQYTGQFSAPPELANTIHGYLKDPSTALSTFANYAGTLKNIVLSSGVPGTGINAHGLNILARTVLADKNPIGGLVKGTAYLLNPSMAEHYFSGHLPDAVHAAKAGLMLSTEEHAVDQVYGNLFSKGLGKLKDVQGKLFEKPLFQNIIPAIKLQHYQATLSDLAQHLPGDQAAHEAAKITNNIFGGINWEEMGRSKEMQNLLRSTVLAPDWAESNIRIGGGIAKSLFSPTNPAGKAYRTFARNLVAAYTAANVANKALTGHFMWQNTSGHTFEIQAGYTSDGKERYIKPFGTAVDFARLPYDVALSAGQGDLSGIFRVIRNRLSLPLGTAVGLLSNTDYAGRPIYGKDRYGQPLPVKQQVGNIAAEVSNLGVPQYGQAAINYASGRDNAEQAASQALELPTRYAGGAFSANQQKQVTDLQSQGQSGQDINQVLNIPKQVKQQQATFKGQLQSGSPVAQAGEVAPGITRLADGSYEYSLNGKAKKTDNLPEALFATSKKPYAKIGDTFYSRDKAGKIHTQDATAMQNSLEDAQFNLKTQQLQRAGDFTNWTKLQQARLGQLEQRKSQLDPVVDQAKILGLTNTQQDIATQLAKYGSYGGFHKPKKPKKPKVPKVVKTVKGVSLKASSSRISSKVLSVRAPRKVNYGNFPRPSTERVPRGAGPIRRRGV